MSVERVRPERRQHIFTEPQLEGLGVWCVLAHTHPDDVETYLVGDELHADCQVTGGSLVLTYDAKARVI